MISTSQCLHPDQTIINQAIAYKSQKLKDLHSYGWALLTPVEADAEPGQQSDLIEVVKLEESPVRKARIAFDAPWLEELGVFSGDVGGIKKNRDYEITIDDVKYSQFVRRTSCR